MTAGAAQCQGWMRVANTSPWCHKIPAHWPRTVPDGQGCRRRRARRIQTPKSGHTIGYQCTAPFPRSVAKAGYNSLGAVRRVYALLLCHTVGAIRADGTIREAQGTFVATPQLEEACYGLYDYSTADGWSRNARSTGAMNSGVPT